VSCCNRWHADRAKDDALSKRYTSAGSISDEAVTLIVILGVWGFLGAVCGGEDSRFQQIHRWNLPVLTVCLGKAYSGERVFYFYF